MVSDATKKYREIFAYGLLGVAALYFIGGLSLLFKSGDDLGGAGFADKSALFGYVFTHPLLVISLFGAVALATAWEDNSKNAKTIVLVALGIGALSLLLALICWLAAFGADTETGSFVFNGVFGAGKVVGIFLGLAQLGLLGLVEFYAIDRLPDLPEAGAGTAPAGPVGPAAGRLGPAARWLGYSRVATTRARPSRVGVSSRVATTRARPSRVGASSRVATTRARPSRVGVSSKVATTRARRSGAPPRPVRRRPGATRAPSQAEQQGQPAASWGQPDEPTTGQSAGWGDQGAAAPETPLAAGAPTARPPQRPPMRRRRSGAVGLRAVRRRRRPRTRDPGRNPARPAASSEEERKDDDNAAPAGLVAAAVPVVGVG